jgi:hypothetical protein
MRADRSLLTPEEYAEITEIVASVPLHADSAQPATA